MTDCAVKRNATYSMYEEVNTKICGKDPQGLGGHMGIDNSASHCKFILRIGRTAPNDIYSEYASSISWWGSNQQFICLCITGRSFDHFTMIIFTCTSMPNTSSASIVTKNQHSRMSLLHESHSFNLHLFPLPFILSLYLPIALPSISVLPWLVHHRFEQKKIRDMIFEMLSKLGRTVWLAQKIDITK